MSQASDQSSIHDSASARNCNLNITSPTMVLNTDRRVVLLSLGTCLRSCVVYFHLTLSNITSSSRQYLTLSAFHSVTTAEDCQHGRSTPLVGDTVTAVLVGRVHQRYEGLVQRMSRPVVSEKLSEDGDTDAYQFRSSVNDW